MKTMEIPTEAGAAEIGVALGRACPRATAKELAYAAMRISSIQQQRQEMSVYVRNDCLSPLSVPVLRQRAIRLQVRGDELLSAMLGRHSDFDTAARLRWPPFPEDEERLKG